MSKKTASTQHFKSQINDPQSTPNEQKDQKLIDKFNLVSEMQEQYFCSIHGDFIHDSWAEKLERCKISIYTISNISPQ